MPSVPPPTAAQRLRQQGQLQLLEAAMQRCLPAAGDEARRHMRESLEQSVQSWHGRDAGAGDVMARVAGAMRQAAIGAGMANPPTDDQAGSAFARALLEHAGADIAREAGRAGHAATFEALRPWLDTEPPAGIATALAHQLALEPAHLQLALARLRRRFRQRVETGLALWSSTPEQRHHLRRQLHAALSPGETQP